jgi:hypothetical protein
VVGGLKFDAVGAVGGDVGDEVGVADKVVRDVVVCGVEGNVAVSVRAVGVGGELGEMEVVEKGGAEDVGVNFLEGVGEVGSDACECMGL